MTDAAWQDLEASPKAWREAFERGQTAAASSSTGGQSTASVQPTGNIPMSDVDLKLRVEQAVSVEWVRALLAKHQ
eukprot:10923649-Alexandrium_andersonii.AAC.1